MENRSIHMKKMVFCLLLMMSMLTVSAQKLNAPILGGELSNSAATSVEDIDEVDGGSAPTTDRAFNDTFGELGKRIAKLK